MRYRTLDENGDYVLGLGTIEFLVNNSACVAQAIQTRLLLAAGEWFLDTTEGTPYSTKILGTHTQTLYDVAIRDRILGTLGVLSIDDYASNLSPQRQLTVAAIVSTIYGQVPLVLSL